MARSSEEPASDESAHSSCGQFPVPSAKGLCVSSRKSAVQVWQFGQKDSRGDLTRKASDKKEQGTVSEKVGRTRDGFPKL